MTHLVPATDVIAVMKYWIEFISLCIELIAVIIIVFSVLYGTYLFIYQSLSKQLSAKERFHQYKSKLGSSLLLGLEILVAADVIRTVALEPTLLNVSVLGILVVIRTFLSWSLMVEIEGHWPWRPKSHISE